MNPQISTDELLHMMLKEIVDMRKSLVEHSKSGDLKLIWLPRNDVMEFFEYGDTKMKDLKEKLVVSQVGNRQFFQRESILNLLEGNIRKK